MINTQLIIGNVITPCTPEAVAEMFAGMKADEQARFFNRVAAIASTWSGAFPMQLQYITDDCGLSLAGRRVMQEIGDYSHWGLVPRVEIVNLHDQIDETDQISR